MGSSRTRALDERRGEQRERGGEGRGVDCVRGAAAAGRSGGPLRLLLLLLMGRGAGVTVGSESWADWFLLLAE
jgi:hypothetical protein